MDHLTESVKLELGIGLSNTPVLLINESFKVSWVNNYVCSLIGKTKENCFGLDFSEMLSSLNEKNQIQINQQFQAEQNFNFELDVKARIYAFACTPIYDFNKAFAGYSLIGKDVTEIKNFDKLIQESYNELSEFFKNNVSPMCFTSIEGNFIMANTAYGDLFKIDVDLLPGKNFLDIHCAHLDPDEQEIIREESAKTLNSKKPKHTTELKLIDAEGKSLQVEVTRKIVKVRNRPVVSVHVNDVTEKFEIRNLITEQNNRLREFTFLTSHKLRQPLANVLGLIDLVRSESESSKDVTITMETLRMLAGQLDHVVHEMGQVLAELDVEVEKSLFYKKEEQGRVEEIWLVDDDQVISYITERMIRNADPSVKVISFLSAKLALEKLRIGDYAPDLLLLDINMPGLNGWQFLDELRNMHRYVNVYMYSSSIDPEDVKKARSYPMVRDFLSKPVDATIIRRVLDMPIIKSRVS
ncbi:MAG: response regulator [Bacteroidia bacterium]